MLEFSVIQDFFLCFGKIYHTLDCHGVRIGSKWCHYTGKINNGYLQAFLPYIFHLEFKYMIIIDFEIISVSTSFHVILYYLIITFYMAHTFLFSKSSIDHLCLKKLMCWMMMFIISSKEWALLEIYFLLLFMSHFLLAAHSESVPNFEKQK